MLIRGMQGGFKESMVGVKEIDSSIESLIDYLEVWCQTSYMVFEEITPDSIIIQKSVYDSRNGWNTYMVLLSGFPVAYIDGPLGE